MSIGFWPCYDGWLETFCGINTIHRNNLHKAAPVNAARRERTLTLERFLVEEDLWKMSLVLGSEMNDGTKGRSCCSLEDKNTSAKISEGINENEYTGEQVHSCSAHVSLIQENINR